MREYINYNKDLCEEGLDIKKQILELEWNIQYKLIKDEGLILDADTIAWTLEYFVNIDDSEKIEYLSFVLNKYYPNRINELMDEFLELEKFELCDVLKNYINNRKYKNMKI
jgi:hypothetical protein